MKTRVVKMLLVCGSVFLCLEGKAQITISQSEINGILTPGNILPTITDNTITTLNIGTAGSLSNNWNFSHLATNSFQVFRAVSAASSPWIAQHPGATHCLRLDTNFIGISGSIYQYLQLTPTQLINMGAMGRQSVLIGTLEFRLRVIPNEIVYGLPLTVGTSWATEFTNWTRISLNNDSIGGSLTTHRARYTIDAAGWMTLPNDSRRVAALRIRKVNFYNNSPVGGYIFLSRGGAQVFVETYDTVTTSGVITVAQGKTLWNNSIVPGQDITLDVPLSDAVPRAFSLSQNYPNPFNPSTTIHFTLPQSSAVSLKVFNTLGQEVAELASGDYDAGSHAVVWNAEGLASGLYYYKLVAGKFSETKAMVLVR